MAPTMTDRFRNRNVVKRFRVDIEALLHEILHHREVAPRHDGGEFVVIDLSVERAHPLEGRDVAGADKLDDNAFGGNEMEVVEEPVEQFRGVGAGGKLQNAVALFRPNGERSPGVGEGSGDGRVAAVGGPQQRGVSSGIARRDVREGDERLDDGAVAEIRGEDEWRHFARSRALCVDALLEESEKRGAVLGAHGVVERAVSARVDGRAIGLRENLGGASAETALDGKKQDGAGELVLGGVAVDVRAEGEGEIHHVVESQEGGGGE